MKKKQDFVITKKEAQALAKYLLYSICELEGKGWHKQCDILYDLETRLKKELKEN